MPAENKFERLLGDGRGVSDSRSLRERLAGTERELTAAQGELRRSRKTTDSLESDVRALKENVEELKETLHLEGRRAAANECERDLARYAALRGGIPDPLVAVEPVHQAVWTKGRPYLTGQHVFDPSTSACYYASPGGVPAGRPPGRSRGWQRCDEDAYCPEPASLSTSPHPAASGYALRQDRHWWDAKGEMWTLAELSREHLLGVIEWWELPERADRLWADELQLVPLLAPCPPNAYQSSREWITDSPLMRALLAEKRRRRIRRPPARIKPWTWGDEHAF